MPVVPMAAERTPAIDVSRLNNLIDSLPPLVISLTSRCVSTKTSLQSPDRQLPVRVSLLQDKNFLKLLTNQKKLSSIRE